MVRSYMVFGRYGYSGYWPHAKQATPTSRWCLILVPDDPHMVIVAKFIRNHLRCRGFLLYLKDLEVVVLDLLIE